MCVCVCMYIEECIFRQLVFINARFIEDEGTVYYFLL